MNVLTDFTKDATGRYLPDLTKKQPVYITFRNNIDCIGCDPHMANIIFEKQDYQKGIVLFCLSNTPGDLQEFIQEVNIENIPVYILTGLSLKDFNIKGRFLHFLFAGKERMLDILCYGKDVVHKKLYGSPKDHMDYNKIKSFFNNES